MVSARIWSVMAVQSVLKQFLPLSSSQMTRVACFPCSGIPREGKGHRKGRSFPDGAVHCDGSPMTLDDFRHNVEPHAQAGDRSLLGTRGPIEALKDFVALLSWDAETMIMHTDRDRLFGGTQVHLDRLGIGRILDGITDQVGEDLSESVSIPDQAGLCRTTHHEGMPRTCLLPCVRFFP